MTLRVPLAVLITLLTALIAALPGSWEVYGAPPLEVTPRGTGPVFPGSTPGRTPTPLPAASTPIAPQSPVAPPQADESPEARGAEPRASDPPAAAILVPPPATPAAGGPPVLAQAGTMPAPPPEQRAGQPGQTSVSIPSAGELPASPGSEVRLAIPHGSVIAKIPSGAAASRLRYQEAVLTPEQGAAAAQQGLLPTNIVFDLAFDPAISPPAEVTLLIDYLPEQVHGIDTASIGLFRWDRDRGKWAGLEGCINAGDQRRVQCPSQGTGSFLLVGTQEAGSPDPETRPSARLWWVLPTAGLLALVGGYLFLRGRREA